MKIDEVELIRRAEEAARRVMQCVPGLEVVQAETPARQGEPSPDLLIDLRGPSLRKRLVLNAKTRGEPRLARAAVNELLLYRRENKGVYGIFVWPKPPM